jgi:hypothetical protein
MLDDVARSKTLVFPPTAQRIELAVGRFNRSRLVTESVTDKAHSYDPGCTACMYSAGPERSRFGSPERIHDWKSWQIAGSDLISCSDVGRFPGRHILPTTEP